MRTRVILIGASNLRRSLPLVLATARHLAGGPVEAWGALGHGRSFGRSSRVLGRTLPGILDCGLWAALDRAEEAPRTLALVTDVGNDIVYGVPGGTLAEWVDACVARLAAIGARTILTQLPVESIDRTGPVRFGLARAILFPRHRITRGRVGEQTALVAGALCEIARRRGIDLVAMPDDWYGLDPIHIRRRRQVEAWRTILSGWTPGGAGPAGRPSGEPPLAAAEGRALRAARAERRWQLGRLRTTPQPAARLGDGTTLSLY